MMLYEMYNPSPVPSFLVVKKGSSTLVFDRVGYARTIIAYGDDVADVLGKSLYSL